MFNEDQDIRILVVDDKTNFLHTVIRMLNSLGYDKIHKAVDGDLAMEILSDDPDYDLILCDWNMPRKNGLEVLKEIRENNQLADISFIMVTAEVDSIMVASAGEIDLDGYLLKPFTLNDLKSKIDQALNKRQNPTSMDVYINLSEAHFKNHDFDKAMEEIVKAQKINQKSPRVYYIMGQILEAQKEQEKAKKAYERAVFISPKYLKAHMALSNICKSNGDLASAANHLDQVVAISPGDVDRQLKLSRYLIKTGQQAKAKSVLKTVMRLSDKKNADVARQVGEAFMEAGLYSDAQGAFKKGMSLDPTDVYMYNRMGIALRRQKKFSEAVSNYQLALGINPNDENLYYNLARAFHEAGQKENAVIAMKKALNINKDFSEAKAFLEKVGPIESEKSSPRANQQ